MGTSFPEGGWLVGSTQEALPGSYAQSGEGSLLWADKPHIMTSGDWRPEELRTVEHPLGRVAVVGECLATEGELHAAADMALETNDPAVLASLPGSYTSIMLDDRGAHFVGDAASQYPLYLQQDNGGVRFSTHTKPFRSGPLAAPPDRLSLALGIGMPWVHELRAGRSPVEGVRTTLPQEIVHVDREGRTMTTPHNSMVPEKPFTIDEAAERLREAMRVSVQRRTGLGYKLSADYSGGFDSTSAAYFFADGLDEPLTIITQYSPDMPVDDLDYVKRYLELAESAGKFQHHIFERSADTLRYTSLHTVDAGDIPDISINSRGRYEEYFAFVRSLGSELHITGSGADELFDMPPRQYLGQLARPASLARFMRAVFAVARAEKDSVRNVMADSRRFAASEPRDRLLELAHILKTPGTYSGALIADIFGAGTAPNWLTKTARREIAEYAAGVADKSNIPAGMDKANHGVYSELLAMGATGQSMRWAAARHGLRQSTVYYDTAILQACLGVPAHERMSPWVFKQLMGRAFAGIVPTEVTSRRTKGDYTKHVFEGLRGSQDVLRALLKDSRLADLGIIEPATVMAALERGFLGANMPLPSLDMLIASEIWLRSLDNESWSRRDKYVASPAPQAAPDTITEAVKEERLSGHAAYGMPQGVIAVTRGNLGATIVNMPVGKYWTIRPECLQIMRALQQTGGSVSGAYERLAEVYPGVPRHVLEDRAETYIKGLIDKRILSEEDSGFTLLEGNVDQTIVPPSNMIPEVEHTPDVGVRDYAVAFGGLALGSVLRHTITSFERQVRLMDVLRSKLARRPATPEEATRILAAVRRIGGLHLGRVACLELSMATVLASALRGKHAYTVLGVRSDPESFHAWPQAGDIPIRTQADELIAGVYQPLIKL
jgi:asparagine synthase (glutamine-hydrolysing)